MTPTTTLLTSAPKNKEENIQVPFVLSISSLEHGPTPSAYSLNKRCPSTPAPLPEVIIYGELDFRMLRTSFRGLFGGFLSRPPHPLGWELRSSQKLSMLFFVNCESAVILTTAKVASYPIHWWHGPWISSMVCRVSKCHAPQQGLQWPYRS